MTNKHLDMLGQEIFEGDFVCGSYATMGVGIAVFIVVRVTAEMIQLRKYDVKNPHTLPRRYSEAVIKLNDEQTKCLLFSVIKNLENK